MEVICANVRRHDIHIVIERPCIFGIRAFVCHHNPKSADFRVNDRPESVQGQAVFLHPPIEDVMWADGMLDWKQRRDFVMPQDYFTRRIEYKSDIEVPILPVGMPRLGLSHDEGVVLAGDDAKRLGLSARNVDRALLRELDMIQIQNLVVEALQRTLGQRNQTDWQLKAG